MDTKCVDVDILFVASEGPTIQFFFDVVCAIVKPYSTSIDADRFLAVLGNNAHGALQVRLPKHFIFRQADVLICKACQGFMSVGWLRHAAVLAIR